MTSIDQPTDSPVRPVGEAVLSPPADFAWSAHPVREDARRAAISVVVVTAMAVLTAAAMGSVLWGVLAAVILVVALNRFFFPSRFVVDADGITARYPLARDRRLWSEIDRFAHDAHAALLTPRGPSRRRARLRGMAVPLGSDPARVVAEIRRHVKEADPAWAAAVAR